jgi:protein associated with RNAse G/E
MSKSGHFDVYTEYKLTYFGETKVFDCSLLSFEKEELVLLYKPTHAMNFAGITFEEGALSFGYYWQDRHYNVYHWKDKRGKTILYYFNVSKETVISEKNVKWVDLIVDVELIPGQSPKILDEEEVPVNFSKSDASIVRKTTKHILQNMNEITGYLESRTNELLGNLF